MNTYRYDGGSEFPYQYKYQHAAITADCVVFSFDGKKLKVLLIKRGNEPYKNKWAFPGGFLKMDETVEECARRELNEETSLTPTFLEQLNVFSMPGRDPRERVISIAYIALAKETYVKGGDDASEARWFEMDNLPALAFDHSQIMDAALSRLKKNIHFKPVGFDMMPDVFTCPDLQRLYEAVLGVKLDRRNFLKKMMSLGLLERIEDIHREKNIILESGAQRARAPRIPIKYKFNLNKYNELKENGFRLEF